MRTLITESRRRPAAHAHPWRPTSLGALLLIGVLTLAVAREPGVAADAGDCSSTPSTVLWSADRAYKASLIRTDCSMSARIHFSVRIDAASPPAPRAWFVAGYALDNDARADIAPTLRWATPRRLEVQVSTRTLRGTLTENVGDDLTLVRTYVARKPGAFPNHHDPDHD